MKEKRLDIRIEINIETYIDAVFVGEKIVTLPKTTQTFIKNISCSGALLVTELDFPENMNFCIRLSIQDILIDGVATIVRRYEGPDGSHYYGCKFLGLDESIVRQIRHYIFTEQIKLRKSK